MKVAILKILTAAALVLATTATAQSWDCGSPTASAVTATLGNGTLTISG